MKEIKLNENELNIDFDNGFHMLNVSKINENNEVEIAITLDVDTLLAKINKSEIKMLISFLEEQIK
jgi:16S rRNA U1498 N3-methylase RsmE